MLKFVNTVVLEDDGKDEYNTEAEVVMAVLSAEVLYLRDAYKEIFSGLDDMIRAYNAYVEEEQSSQ